uniref:Uncharacterized protein n=1 Tax=Onchocerca volvulus TaxID=6282 RepID=A0A8R1TNJ9_ONCVO
MERESTIRFNYQYLYREELLPFLLKFNDGSVRQVFI